VSADRRERSPVGFLAGGGELGKRIRDFDWSETSLGPVDAWPESLRIAVGIMLASRQPIWIGWGDDLTYLYNDPYKAIIGGKHPQMLGEPTQVVWAEIWDVIAPMLETAMYGDEGTYVESQLLIMERHGYREETYYTFSYSPIRDVDGTPQGIICANTDDTQRVMSERQLDLLRELAATTTEVLTWRELCEGSARALASNPFDLPFALIYIADDDANAFVLAGTSGIEAGHPAAPEVIPFESERAARLLGAFGSREVFVADDVDALAPAPLPTGAWDEPPTSAAYVRLASRAKERADGVLVVGLNPFRLFDDAYADFLSLIGGQISASLATAQAYEGERHRAEALAELDRAKTEFFSNVSHEFRTPLTLMLGPIEDMLAAEHAVPDGTRPQLEVIHRNALRLLRMVNMVLDFSRVGSGQIQSVYRPTDLARFTGEIAAHFAPLMERAKLGFTLDLSPLPEPVYVDGEAWDKIVLNLLSNAFKFTMDGEVRIALDTADGMARLRVSDTGTGVPESELPQLFERFHRVRNDQARAYEGTGIGLALVRELVEIHGGSVSVGSRLGEGTTFTVLMPFGADHLPPGQVSGEPRSFSAGELALAYTEEAARWVGVGADAAALSPVARTETRGDARVAVVDDNTDMREYIVRLLEPHWHVTAYADGQEALDAILENPPALVVTDVMMPRLDGFGLLSALRSNAATALIPVVVVSARAGEESSVEGLDAGADDYLVKPFSARELVARVRTNVELARLRADAGRASALEDVRTRVITTVSHELRTPVAAIYGASQTLERSTALDPETQRQLLDVIGREAERLARITSDILTTEALAAGLFSVSSEEFDVRTVVAEAVRAAQARPAGGIEVSAALPDQRVDVIGDRSRLEQVVANLLDNAVKYSPGGGAVEASVEPLDGRVDVVIADTGSGVPEDERELIFQRFYRLDPELSGGVGGTGLGLYISRQMIEAMGGTIRVEANEPRGSRFVVSLPAAAP
jgi:signal transduction histidine kinase